MAFPNRKRGDTTHAKNAARGGQIRKWETITNMLIGRNAL